MLSVDVIESIFERTAVHEILERVIDNDLSVYDHGGTVTDLFDQIKQVGPLATLNANYIKESLKSRTSREAMMSRPFVGSSKMMNSGSWITEMAKETFWRIP